MTRAAAVLAWLSGFGFGIPAVIGMRYFAQNDAVWTFMGFPTYGGGPFETWGFPTSIPLLAGFVAVCLAEIIIGVLLWTEKIGGTWMALAILPFELVYWIGFALPFGLVFGLARTVLVLVGLTR